MVKPKLPHLTLSAGPTPLGCPKPTGQTLNSSDQVVEQRIDLDSVVLHAQRDMHAVQTHRATCTCLQCWILEYTAETACANGQQEMKCQHPHVATNAACLQSGWEVRNGGVSTRNLQPFVLQGLRKRDPGLRIKVQQAPDALLAVFTDSPAAVLLKFQLQNPIYKQKLNNQNNF